MPLKTNKITTKYCCITPPLSLPVVVVNLSDPLQSLGVIGAVSGVHVVQPGGEGGHGEVLVLGGEDDQGDGEREEPDGEDGSKYDRASA